MKRTNNRQEMIGTLNGAKRTAFASLSFKAINSMLEFGIFKEINKTLAAYNYPLPEYRKNG